MKTAPKTKDLQLQIPNVAEVISTSVTQRTKWDRKAGRKLAKKAYVSRIIYKDPSGKKKEKTKEFIRKKDAEDHLRIVTEKFERSGGRELDAERMTFNDLADHYERHYAKKAEYSDDRKISGLRSLDAVQGYIRTLRSEIGGIKLSNINYGVLRDLRSRRLDTLVVIRKKKKIALTQAERSQLKTRKRTRIEFEEISRPRKIASVNRELATLRHMLSIAETEGWITKNPFRNGPGLIQLSAETMRTRILSVEEEHRLLSVCSDQRWSRLKSIIICLLDTGMRFNELRTLTWDCVDLDSGIINIKAFHTKTAKAKTVAITARLRDELLKLREAYAIEYVAGNAANQDLVFGIKSNVSSSWTTVRRLAGIEDVRLHDLRHTFGTRLNQLGLSQASIARSLGHQQIATTYRYINADKGLADTVRNALESFHAAHSDAQEMESIN